MTTPAATLTATRRRRSVSGIQPRQRVALIALADAACALIAAAVGTRLAMALVALPISSTGTIIPIAAVAPWQPLFVIAWLTTLQALGAGDLLRPRLGRRSVQAVLWATIFLSVVSLVLVLLFPGNGGRPLLVSVPLAAVLTLATRFGYLRLVSSPLLAQRVVMVGVDEAARRAAAVITDTTAHGPYSLVAFVDPANTAARIDGTAVVPGDRDLWELLSELDVDLIVVGHTRSLPPGSLSELVRCFEHGIGAVAATQLYEELTGRVMVSALEADWYAEIPTRTAGLYAPMKRAIDLIVACAAVLFVPVLVLIGVAVWIESRGPILIRQVRVGQRGERFTLHKFRTMRIDAELDGEPRWSVPEDPRRTRVGRVLRRTHFDELPQLWNVFVGDMSLIGPRPERPEFVERLSAEMPLYRARSLVRPGITGWAQVLLPYGDSVAWNLSKLEFDLYYVRHFGPLLDLSIALRTFAIVVGLAKPDYADRPVPPTDS